MPKVDVLRRLSVFSRISQKLVGLAILVVLLAKPGRPAQNDPKIHDGEAHLVLLEGKVITVDPNDSIAEAIAVKGGRIESDQIKDIRVLMTLIDGKIVWRAGM
jgi:hypothetical protein